MAEITDSVLIADLLDYLEERGWRLVRVVWQGGELVAIVEETNEKGVHSS